MPRSALISSKLWNHACLVLAPVLLLTALWSRNTLSPPAIGDFTQYYMGAQIASQHQWASLYPTPIPGSDANPGHAGASISAPEYRRIATECGVGESWRFIQPPLAAFLLQPLARWPLAVSHRRFVDLLGLCLALTIGCTGLTHIRIIGQKSSPAPGILMIVLALSPSVISTARTANVSGIIALCIGITTVTLFTQAAAIGYLSLAIGAIQKYASLMLVPAELVLRGPKAAVGIGLSFAAVAAASVAVAGWQTNVQFLKLARSFNHPEIYDGNHSLLTFILRLQNTSQLPPAQNLLFEIARWGALLLISTLVWSRRTIARQQPLLLCSVCVAFVSWFLVFSPVSHGHYHVYLLPFLGWAVEIARGRRLLSALMVLAGALLYFPLAGSGRMHLPLVVSVHMLWADIILLSVALKSVAAERSCDKDQLDRT